MYIKITGLVKAVLILHFEYVYTMERVISSRFVAHKNTRANFTPDRFVNTPSAIACAGICRSSNGCTAANYLKMEEECHLLYKACFLTENAVGWSFITIQLPRKDFLYISNRTETWNGAKNYCNSIGGQLANILSQSDNHNVIKRVTLFPDIASVWIGGSDLGSEGDWYWSNGCHFNDQDFNFWGPNQPNNYLDKQHCLAIYNWVNEGGFFWDDDICDEYYFTFICEIPIV